MKAMCITFLDMILRHTYSVNMTFTCTRKPKLLCDSHSYNIHFIVVVYNQTNNISKVCKKILINIK